MSNRLYILLNAFFIGVFLLYSIVFVYPYYMGLFLGIVLVVARKCELLLFNVCLPYNIYILGRFSRYFLGFLLDSFSLFRLGVVRIPSLGLYTILYKVILRYFLVYLFKNKLRERI